MSTVQPPLTVVDLPLPGTKGAPKKFKGDFSEVDRFLHYYERLCSKYNVAPDEQVENITQYCSRVVRETMEGLSTYESKDWDRFKADVRKLYEADKDAKRYRTRDLENYIRRTRKRTKDLDMEAWVVYRRGFVRIGGWLKRQNKIDQDEYDMYLWKGIPKAFRCRLEHRIMSQNPNHDLSTPFPTTSIVKAAETLLKRDRFDNDRLPSDSEESDAADSSSTDLDSDAEDSGYESLADAKKPLRKAVKKPKVLRKKKVTFKSTEDDEDEVDAELSAEEEASRRPRKSSLRQDKAPARTPSSSREQEEVEDLIKQLGKLSIDDPTYAILYFRAVTRNPLVKDIVPSPSLQRRSSTPTPSTGRFERQAPPHMAGGAVGSRPERGKCWGCGEAGHNMFACPALADLEKQGVIKRDRQGRVFHSNGDTIRRLDLNETIVQAVTRAAPPTSNYIGIDESWDWELDASLENGEEATVTLYNYLCDSEDEAFQEAYPVESATYAANTARKERFDGVYVPPRRPALAESKENRRPGPSGMRSLPGNPAPPVPVEVRAPQYNGQDDDVIMEDQTNVTPKAPARSERPSRDPPKDKPKDSYEPEGPRMARRSDVQGQVNPKAMLRKLLDTPITVGVGELLAVSREMAQQVQEVIKPKPQPRVDGKPAVRLVELDGSVSPDLGSQNIVASATFAPRTRGQLIRVKFECDGVPISAIVDTGSQLNIAHKRIWQQALIRPMDVTRRITMNDANGGEGILHGFIPEIPLTCGSVLTYANVYVGNQAPFDLLLGRPWQRGNYVSIDERKDGTYLLFKDKEFNVRFEMLATPERDLEPMIADYLAKSSAAASMFVQESEPDVFDAFLQENWMDAFGGALITSAGPGSQAESEDQTGRFEEIEDLVSPEDLADPPESPPASELSESASEPQSPVIAPYNPWAQDRLTSVRRLLHFVPAAEPARRARYARDQGFFGVRFTRVALDPSSTRATDRTV